MIITPKAGKGTGMVAKAKELAEKHGWPLISRDRVQPVRVSAFLVCSLHFPDFDVPRSVTAGKILKISFFP